MNKFSLRSILALLLFPVVASAQDRTWIVPSGSWDVSTNWSGGAVPTAAANAFITTGTASLGAGISGTANQLTVSGSTGNIDDPLLSISGGFLSTSSASIGSAIGQAGFVTLSSGTWNNSGLLSIGTNGGLGTLTLSGGTLFSGSGAVVGQGVIRMSGGTWNNNGHDLTIGQELGALTLSAGLITNGNAYLAAAPTPSGQATLLMTGGTWNSSGVLYVGYSGTALTQVYSGLIVSSTIRVAELAGSSGDLSLISNSFIVVAPPTVVTGQIAEGAGSGTLTLASGTLRAANDQMDFISGFEPGDVTLGGSSGSLFAIDSNGFHIGISTTLSGTGWLYKVGSGTLTISGSQAYSGGTAVDGGTLEIGPGAVIGQSTSFQAGLGTGKSGTLLFDGGQIANNSVIALGSGSNSFGALSITTGTMNLQGLGIGLVGTGSASVSGGLVNSGFTSLGMTGTNVLSVSSGTLNSTALYVGTQGSPGSGVGVLNITGGLVGAGMAAVGESGGRGIVTVSGGTWNATQLVIGYNTSTTAGSGVVNLNGGSVTSGLAVVGYGTHDSGTATVTGGTWTGSDSIIVGYSGTGLLAIGGTGVVTTGSVVLADQAGSSGLLNINAGGLLQTAVVVNGTGAGAINFNGGTLRAQTTQANFLSGFGPGKVMISAGGAFIDSNGFNLGIGSVLSGTGGLTKLGSGTLTLNGTNSYTGGTTVAAGTLRSGTSGAFVANTAYTVNGGTLDLNNINLTASSLSGTGGTVNLGSALLAVNQSGSTSYAGSIIGTGALTKLGAGALTLSGANTYTGSTTIRAGRLTVAGSITQPAADVTVGDLSGDAAELQIASGGLVSGSNGYLGQNSGASGTANVSGTWNTAAVLNVGRGGTGVLNVNSGGYVSAQTGWIATGTGSAGTVVVNGGTFSTTASLLVGYRGTGTLTVTNGYVSGGNNFVLGNNDGSQGTVNLNSGGYLQNSGAAYIGLDGAAVGLLTVNGGTWNSSGSVNIGNNATGTVTLNSGAIASGLTNIGSNATGRGTVNLIGGTWSNTGAFNVGNSGTGTLNLIGGVLTSSTITLANGANSVGVLNIGTGTTAGTLNASLIRSGSGAATVNFNHTGTVNFATGMAGTLAVNKLGAGTTVLTGSSSYTGDTTISGGRLAVNGVLGNTAVTVGSGATLSGTGRIGGSVVAQNGSTIAAGNSPGTLTVVGNFTFQSGSLFDVEGDGAFFDRIDIGGVATIQSGAEISFTLLTTPTEASYTLLTATSGLDGSVEFSLSGSLPAGYQLVYSGTSLMLVNQASIGTVTVTPADSTIITGGTTSVTVAVENSALPGGQDLNATVTGTGQNITGTGTTTVAAGTTGTASPNLAFSSTAIGTQTGTVTVVDPDASNSPQTGTTTVTVLDHAAPTLTISGGDNQSVIVGATGITATLTLSNGTSGAVNLSPMDVQNLSSGLSGTTGSGVIASGASSNYTASLNTGTVGAGQTQTFSLDAGDQQTLAGANPLTTQSGTVTLNVYGHADPILSGTTLALGNIHVGYGTAVTSGTQIVTNGSGTDYIVDLKADSVTSGNFSINGVGGVSAGNSASLAATLATGQGVGVINENLTYAFADDSALAGASSNIGTSTLNITGLVYSGQGVWTSTSGGSWGTLASGFGANWQTTGGSPGLDSNFTDTDTATFGTAGSGVVTLDGAFPSLKGITFDNASQSYELQQGSSGIITLNGGTGTATIENLNGTHLISTPVTLATDTIVSVANSGDVLGFTPSSLIGGTGQLIKQGAGSIILTSANTYSGGTRIEAGTISTSNTAALGTGAVALNGGTLAPVGHLTINSLTWTGGQLGLSLGSSGSSLLEVTGNATNGGAGGSFAFSEGTGFATNTSYTILVVDGTMTGFSLADFTGNAILGLAPTFTLVGNELRVSFNGAVSGGTLSNYAPIYTPTTADFLVNGNVQTSNAPNTVNSLTFANGSLLTVFNKLVVTSGLFTVNSGSATMGGPGIVSTPGDFTKLGSGLLNILTTLIANGNINVQQGILSINGTASAQDLIVQLGAVLKGSGFIFSNVFNNGTVAPGNSPGTLTINGNYTQSSSGSLQIELASPSVFDRLIVSGNAQLGGQLQVLSYGGYKFQYGQQFAFLQADSISGSFASIVTSDPKRFRARFLTDDGTGTILLAPTSYALVAQNQNQRNVAKALNSYIPAGGDREKVSIALDYLTAEQYPAAFEQIMPGFYESLGNMTIEQSVAQSQIVAQRLGAVRLGARGFSTVGIETALVNDKNGRSVLDAKDGKDILTPAVDNRWGVWVQGNGIFARTYSVANVPNSHYESGGVFTGLDYQWSENFTTGLYAGYQGLYSKYSGGGLTTINSALFGGYATYRQGGFYADAITGGGYNGYNTRRPIKFSTIDRTADASPYGGQFSTYVDAGYDWKVKGFTFGPLLSGQYTYAGIAPFTERDANSLNLRVNEQNINSLRMNVGGRIAYTWTLSDKITLIPELSLFWQHEFLENPRNIGSALDGGNGPGFGYETSAPDRDSVFAGVGVSAQFGDRWDASFYYNANFGRSDFFGNMISTSFGFKF